MPCAYLSLGSNLGDRCALVREAEARLSAIPGMRVAARSSVYESEPVGPVDQPWFLNRVLEVETTLDPHALFDATQRVEAALGRTRPIRWGPRTIDIDLLLYGDQIVASETLQIPHPELTRRLFVLLPLAEINPRLRLPDGRTIAELLQAHGDGQIVKRVDGL